LAKKKYALIAVVIIIFILTSYFVVDNVTRADDDTSSVEAASASANSNEADSEVPTDDYTYIPPVTEYDSNDTDSINNNSGNTAFVPATELDLDPNSITVFVNKEHALPKDYIPEDLVIPDVLFDIPGNDERKYMREEAADGLENLFSAAEEDGIILYGISGYRSYSRQYKIFTTNIVKQGKNHTLKYSAVPGTSEHQTGLSMDVSSKSLNLKLVTSFSSSEEGIWLAENAHNYGYIIRYPTDKADITGYEYEPWHIRYVGIDLATYLYNNNLTLDEYYNYTPSENFDFEELYSDIINYTPPTPTPTPSPTPTPTPTVTPTPSITPPADSELPDGEDGTTDEDDPVEGDPVEGDPIEGDPIEGDPIEGDPIEGDPIEGSDGTIEDDEPGDVTEDEDGISGDTPQDETGETDNSTKVDGIPANSGGENGPTNGE
jgi:D-alanyl-D-alanine carboxypeptidase